MMRRRGFVLIEILIAVTILAVCATIAFASFNKTKYKAEKDQAITYLRVIRTAEKLYWPKAKTYLALADKATINTQLGIEIQSSYTFVVTVPTATTFTATATSDAASGSKTIILDQDGTWSGTYTPLPSV